MRPEWLRLRDESFDLLVVGGGITGACIARDAAFRGLRVALVEKGDFAQATTAASSKLIHGGLRYLQNLELGFVRQGLRERRTWSNIAPHMVDPLPFIVPTSTQGVKKRAIMHLALSAYDMLSYDRNRLEDPDKSIPAHDNLDRAAVLALEPALEPLEPTGAMRFYDCQMYSPERLALECLLDARDAGAVVLNYAGLTEFLRDGQTITGGRVQPTGGTEHPHIDIHARLTVNASGPWADILMGIVGGHDTPRRLIRSKGIHLITRPLTNGHAIAVQTATAHFFLLPWRGHTLIGTTDTVFEGEPDDVAVTEDDIAAFLAIVNKGFPAARLTRKDVLHFYGGLRPIVEMEGGSCGSNKGGSYGASRAPEVYDHARQHGMEGIITAIGGKWTTSRALAEEVVDMAQQKLGQAQTPASTADRPTRGGHTGRFNAYLESAQAAHPDWPEATIGHLTKNYGSRYADIIALAEANPGLAQPLGDKVLDIGAQVIHAIREELACTLEDVLFRRTGMATLGHPGDDAIANTVALMAAELAWDEQEQQRQVDRLTPHFVPQPSKATVAA